MSDHKKEGTLSQDPPVFKSWNAWYVAVIIGNILFCLWMVFYFGNFN